MRLSEAIRLGAMLRPQAFGYLFAYAWDRGDEFGPLVPELEIGSCALGAAAEACSLVSADNDLWETKLIKRKAVEVFPLLNVLARNPERKRRMLVSNIIPELNDNYRWTRERIADWVETIEREHEASACPENEAVTSETKV